MITYQGNPVQIVHRIIRETKYSPAVSAPEEVEIQFVDQAGAPIPACRHCLVLANELEATGAGELDLAVDTADEMLG